MQALSLLRSYWFNCRAVHSATGERGIVISRSTFVGSGKYGGRWLGDNTSKWPHLKDSIVG